MAAKMNAFESMLTGQRRSNIQRGQQANSKSGARSRRLSNQELINRARSGKASTYEAHLLSRRKSMGGSGG
jgi:hypothetical protein|nr:MAG TPA: hypothetical protein [Caudoviricetes sp.]